MNAGFKFSDLPILLKKDRRFQLGAIVILFTIAFLALHEPVKIKKNNIVMTTPPYIGTGGTASQEIANDLIQTVIEETKHNKGRINELETDIIKQGENIERIEGAATNIFKVILERYNEKKPDIIEEGVRPQEIPPSNLIESFDVSRLETWGDFKESSDIALPPKEKRLVIIGTGDRVRVRLLTGLVAKTDGTPYPVVFQIEGDILGPNFSSLGIGEALVVAAAQGSFMDSRAMFRLTQLNLSFPNGRRKIIPVDGWIVGEDGMAGLRGVRIDPIADALAGAATIGALNGAGAALESGDTITTDYYGTKTVEQKSGDVIQKMLGGTLKGGSEELSKYINMRIGLLEPGIEVLPDRESTAVFAKTVTINDLYEALEEADNDQYALLD